VVESVKVSDFAYQPLTVRSLVNCAREGALIGEPTVMLIAAGGPCVFSRTREVQCVYVPRGRWPVLFL
jgi:hypothetical protein